MSFEVDQGEILGLIGPNGSGKSTIFNMLSGTLAPNGGSIRFEGREIGGQPPHRIINLGIGRTFQIPRPFRRLSILENVMLAGFYGQGRHSRARAFEAAERALELVGLPTDRAAPVDGLGAAALKKLELAKALATAPKLLLADESLSGLDEHEMDQAADLLRRISQRPRHHDHLGGAHHGRPDARGGPRDGARPRREDRRGPARPGRVRSPRDRGVSRHPGGRRARRRPPAAIASGAACSS